MFHSFQDKKEAFGMNTTEGFIPVPGGKVWYRAVGENKNTPLLVLHGGPGFSTYDMEELQGLANERMVIFYDQLGSGRSERPRDKSLWEVDRFVEELQTIRDHLQLEQVHILGHSWGTMLGASYMLTKPIGVRSIVFSSPCLSAKLWAKDQDEYRKELPSEIQEILNSEEQKGTTNSKEYEEAMMEVYRRHVCRLDPWPETLLQSFEFSNLDVYHTMWGPSEFFPTGTLKDFDVTVRLHEIEIPSLFLAGKYDEATPKTTEYYSSLTKHSQFHVFENSSHTAYLEEPREYLQVVSGFLERQD
jgi:proline iminopeptidase